MKSDDQCRALGNAISIGITAGQPVTIRHNTITGQGDCLILSEGGSSSSTLNIQNNALIGQIDWRGNATGNPGELSCGHYAYNSSAQTTYSGNLFWNVKSGQCPSGSTCGQNPKLANMTMAAFDATPLAGSPVIDKAPYLSAVSNDFYVNPRPSGSAADIGAIEVQADGSPPPTPTCTRATPSIGLSGGGSAVVAGSAVNYTLTVSNKDSSACSNTTFNLARNIPSGWSGTLAGSTLTLAPGSSASTSLTVTSAGTADAGNYGIGTGVSSSVGSIHTASASATYTVSQPVPPPADDLSQSLDTNKSTYRRSETVYMHAQVLRDGKPAYDAAVQFTVIRADGRVATYSTRTDRDGHAYRSMRLSRRKSPAGTYMLKATATLGEASVASQTTFNVR
jgi:hypothetical protein